MKVSHTRKVAASKETRSWKSGSTYIQKIVQVKEKYDSLKKAINIMESKFVECIQQAEVENNMALVIKSNGLKR